MSMGLDLLKSTVTNDGFDLDIGDVKLQCNTVLNELNIVSVSFESYMDACNRFLILCDTIEANEGMLDPAIRDFINHNYELSSALGIDLAMEDDSQDTQKENGEKVTEKKQGFFRRIWEGIKKFVQWIFDTIGSFFHWLGNLFASTSKKIDWLKSDGRQIASELTGIPADKIKQFLFGEEKDGKIPVSVVAEKGTENFDTMGMEASHENPEVNLVFGTRSFGDLIQKYQEYSPRKYFEALSSLIKSIENNPDPADYFLSVFKDKTTNFKNSIVELYTLIQPNGTINVGNNGKLDFGTIKLPTTVKFETAELIMDFKRFCGLCEEYLETSARISSMLESDINQLTHELDIANNKYSNGPEVASKKLIYIKTGLTNCLSLVKLYKSFQDILDIVCSTAKRELIKMKFAMEHQNR